MPVPAHLPIVILNALPASGKSEVIAFLESLPDERRMSEFHFGKIRAIDDFVDLHTMQLIDEAREKIGLPRIHYAPQAAGGDMLEDRTWFTLLELLNTRYRTLLAKEPGLLEKHTLLIEFARGDDADAAFPLPYGYEKSYPVLDPDILRRAAVLYVKVSPAESRRRNIKRADPNDPGSILKHGVPEKQMKRWYSKDDMLSLASRSPEGTLKCGERLLPFGVFDNEEEKTGFVHGAPPWPADAVARLANGLRKATDQMWAATLRLAETRR
ncbi:MAG: hypothetical protein HYY93_10335 [Planctomycetes bacterium]|nr:hypothetical protein [Planctomycetota bacterium]